MQKISINTALAIVVIATAVVLIGGSAMMMTTTQTAFAARNCEGDLVSGRTCTGGSGGHGTAEGTTFSGGGGGREVVEPGATSTTQSGGFGGQSCEGANDQGTEQCFVGGSGGNVECDPFCGSDDPGGSGRHVK